jgi:hypothetical protein
VHFVDLPNTSHSRQGMRKKIGNVVLVRRASQYARDKSPEPARPSLKTGGKMEAVDISQ